LRAYGVDGQQQQHQQACGRQQCAGAAGAAAEAGDVDGATALLRLNDGHGAFCAVMNDRLHRLNSVHDLLAAHDANFAVCMFHGSVM